MISSSIMFNHYSNIILFLSILIIISSFMLIFSINPIHSLLFLVLIFLITTCVFLLFRIEYISMLFLVVYLGAIIVLFLFVVMMLNIRILALNEKIITYFPIGFFIAFGFFLELLFTLNENFIIQGNFLGHSFFAIRKIWTYIPSEILFKDHGSYAVTYTEAFPSYALSTWTNSFMSIQDFENLGTEKYFTLLSTTTNLHNLAIMLYTESMHVFILGSIILLIGMLGAIILTLQNLQKTKKQSYYNQNSKNILKSIKKLR